MFGTVYRRHPTTTWSVAVVVLALLFSGLATGRAPGVPGTAPHAALSAGQTAIHAMHWTGNRPLHGKATAVLASTGSGLLAPGPALALAGTLALLLVGTGTRRVRPRRVGRMHAGRGPPRSALS